MSPRAKSGETFRYPLAVVWTDRIGRPRRKVFVWRAAASREVEWLQRAGITDARVIQVKAPPPESA